ncbi:cobalt-precorrin 5A hydrolase [Clostridium punense]|uniref:Cobalt-precorrin 5A hydrolase n=1 Tax=Clostridium punense TaxID=1054297 RepID=A0ABS4K1E5_9CLOT|nr:MULTISPECIES: cobalt-precorrin 5A hydrolase [Clostridium]EQB87434.1 hypothetical protein M918_09305 [Clostridium sp. BL8]MBP2021605.1 cobalt-precorrin 5A hydrolase [Clostridium punense]
MKIAIISVTTLGNNIINKLCLGLKTEFQNLKVTVFNSKDKDFNFKDSCKIAFESSDAVIFISSTGIAVRGIAPHVVNKKSDPAVVVIDSCGKYAISLLSGHLGGANRLTTIISKILNCEAVITTATDNLEVLAPDMIALSNSLYIEDMGMAKTIAALLVEGKKVGFIDEEDLIPCPKGYSEVKVKHLKVKGCSIDYSTPSSRVELLEQNSQETEEYKSTSEAEIEELSGIVVVTSKESLEIHERFRHLPLLRLIRRNIVLGIGCKKDFPQGKMELVVKTLLKDKNIHEKAVGTIATVSIKKEEPAILSLSKNLGVEINTFTPEEIKPIEHKYKTSDFVRKTIGVGAVCEPVIELCKGRVIHEKESFNGMTLAIGVMN